MFAAPCENPYTEQRGTSNLLFPQLVRLKDRQEGPTFTFHIKLCALTVNSLAHVAMDVLRLHGKSKQHIDAFPLW